MELIEKDEMDDFLAVLSARGIDASDFSFIEIDTTDPKTDEIFALQGRLTVVRQSNGLSKQYNLGDGTDWVCHFQRDLNGGVFS